MGDRAALRARAGLRRRLPGGSGWKSTPPGSITTASVLTPEILERQVRSYHAMRDIIDEWHLDFSGIKGQPELTNNFATTDIAEAFLNDPYDWDGPKAPPHLRHRVRHGRGAHDADHAPGHRHARCFLPTCGTTSPTEGSGTSRTPASTPPGSPPAARTRPRTWPRSTFTPRSSTSPPAEPRSTTSLLPGDITLARLSRADGRYRLQVTLGRFERYDAETNEALMRQSTYVWPHAFTRFDAPAEVFLSRFGANHIHAVPGDITAELAAVCRFLDIDLERLDKQTSP